MAYTEYYYDSDYLFDEDDDDVVEEEQVQEPKYVRGEPFFLETPESQERMEEVRRRLLQSTIQSNEANRNRIKQAKKYIAAIQPKLTMSKDELREKIEEQKKIRQGLLHSKNLKMMEMKMKKEIEDQEVSIENSKRNFFCAERKENLEIQERRYQIKSMENALATLNAEKRAWKSISENTTPDADLGELISQQHEANDLTIEQIKYYSQLIQKRLTDAQSKFDDARFYIFKQLQIHDDASAAAEKQKQLQKEKEAIRRFEELRLEEAACRPRLNARKNDLFHDNVLHGNIN
ncbi:unnamed protein product [Caenorhabditis brenneri]